MASSSSRKSNSSASNQKPTFRRSGSSSSVSRSGAIYRASGSSADFGRDRRRTVPTRSGASYRPRLQAPVQRTANLARRGNVSIRKHANRPHTAPRPVRPASSNAFAPSRGTARPSGARSCISALNSPCREKTVAEKNRPYRPFSMSWYRWSVVSEFPRAVWVAS